MSGKVLLMSVVGNGANMVLNYLFIIRWDLASTGAGISQGVSQYLMLLVGLIWISREVSLQEIGAVLPKFWEWSAFRDTLTLNGNIFLKTFVHMSMFAVLINLSTLMGTETLAVNSLLIEVMELIIFFLEGISLATQTLTGNFRGQNATEQVIPLLQVAIASTLGLGLTISGIFALFPQTLFGLFTNHGDIIQQTGIYVPWLLLILGFVAITMILDGYFAALARGEVLRNTSLIAVLLGFVPLAFWASSSHSNHILWLALSTFYLIKMIAIAIEMLWTLTQEKQKIQTPIEVI